MVKNKLESEKLAIVNSLMGGNSGEAEVKYFSEKLSIWPSHMPALKPTIISAKIEFFTLILC